MKKKKKLNGIIGVCQYFSHTLFREYHIKLKYGKTRWYHWSVGTLQSSLANLKYFQKYSSMDHNNCRIHT